jgi:endoglucanase
MKGLLHWNKKIYVFHVLSLLFLFVVVPVAVFVVQKQHAHVRAAGAMPHVQGNQVIDGFGNPLILQGAHIQSALDRIPSAQTPSDIQATRHLNSTTFDAMYNIWHMNTVRIATSDYIWQQNPKSYIETLQQVVAEANQSGLYVVLSLHEDKQSGLPAPEPNGWGMPTTLAKPYWQAIAATFKGNPMVMFDLFNEPNIAKKTGKQITEADWQFWLHGATDPTTGFQVYGIQDLINAIRGRNANQIIIAQALQGSFETFETYCGMCNFLQDPANPTSPNIVYSVHQYFQDQFRTTASWDLKFGNISSQVPIFIGEWALQVNTIYPVRCDHLTPAQAIQLVQDFLSYMNQHGTSWTAFAFMLDQLILNYKQYTPTTFSGLTILPCGNIHATAGMGDIVLGYLLNGVQSFTPTPSPSATPSPTPSPTP